MQFNSPAGWPREGFWPIKLCHPASRCAGKEQDAGGGNERLRRQAFLVCARRPDRGGDCGCDLAAQQNRGSFPGGDDASSSNAKSAVAYAGIPAKVAAGQKFAWVQISLSAFKARISCARASSVARSPIRCGVNQQLGGVLPEELLLVGLRKNERARIGQRRDRAAVLQDDRLGELAGPGHERSHDIFADS